MADNNWKVGDVVALRNKQRSFGWKLSTGYQLGCIVWISPKRTKFRIKLSSLPDDMLMELTGNKVYLMEVVTDEIRASIEWDDVTGEAYDLRYNVLKRLEDRDDKLFKGASKEKCVALVKLFNLVLTKLDEAAKL